MRWWNCPGWRSPRCLARSHLVRLARSLPNPMGNYGSVTVPAGHYLAKGDNREDSDDPRFFGFVREEFNGRARFVALSLDPARQRLSRPDRWGLALQ